MNPPRGPGRHYEPVPREREVQRQLGVVVFTIVGARVLVLIVDLAEQGGIERVDRELFASATREAGIHRPLEADRDVVGRRLQTIVGRCRKVVGVDQVVEPAVVVRRAHRHARPQCVLQRDFVIHILVSPQARLLTGRAGQRAEADGA